MRWLPLVLLVLSPHVQAELLSGKVIAVLDGDTLTIVDAQKRRHRIRLADVDAPEGKQPYGARSGRSLYALCFGKEAQVDARAKEKNRTIGHVTCAGVDAGAEQVRRGMAWVSPKFTRPGSPLYELETYARLRATGLWADPKAMPPWEWRAQNRTP